MKMMCGGLKIGNLIITTKKCLENAKICFDPEKDKDIYKLLKNKYDLHKSPEELLRDGMITHDAYIKLKRTEKYKDGRKV